MPLTSQEIKTLIILERTSASISATATLILITTFCSVKAFRTLSNHLIFYASFANLFASMAALIGGDALDNPDGALCQFQAFLLEMFMQSDPLWACAMAINVYLVFFKRYDPVRLQKLHWVYFLFCYGLPFIPAMFCLFYQDHRGKMYGNATLWCWIDNKYKWVRIYSYYLPIWISIAIALGIYWRVGFEIYRVRAQIRALENSSDNTSNNYNSGTYNSATITSQTVTSGTLTSGADNQKEPQTPGHFDRPPTPDETVLQESMWRLDSADNAGIYHKVHNRENRFGSGGTEAGLQSQHTALSLPHPHSTTSPLDPHYPCPPSNTHHQPPSSHSPQRTTMDKVKWAYTKCALLFGVSILITWVPASINRVHGLTHERNPSFALNVMSAIVLPLQGFWNTVIFFATSWSVVKRVGRKWGKMWMDEKRGRHRERGAKRRARKEGNGKGNDDAVKMEEVTKDDTPKDDTTNMKKNAVHIDKDQGKEKEDSKEEEDAIQQASGRSSDRTLTE